MDKRTAKKNLQSYEVYYETLSELINKVDTLVELDWEKISMTDFPPINYTQSFKEIYPCIGRYDVCVSIYRMDSGRYELTAYITT